jgi:NAD(P)-dependent dehydrogenase (short-subunit alcohol dehydrogenase family)
VKTVFHLKKDYNHLTIEVDLPRISPVIYLDFFKMPSQTWLVTGASSGLGTAIAESALRAGNKVLATARNPEKAASENPQIAELGGVWVRLDVTQTDTARHVEEIIRVDGGSSIDVVVNNAGYSLLGSIEDMSEAEIEAQFSTNLYGPIRVLKGVLPFMRAQRSGIVVNVSSSAAFEAFPGCAMYAGSKFALEGEFERDELEI